MPMEENNDSIEYLLSCPINKDLKETIAQFYPGGIYEFCKWYTHVYVGGINSNNNNKSKDISRLTTSVNHRPLAMKPPQFQPITEINKIKQDADRVQSVIGMDTKVVQSMPANPPQAYTHGISLPQATQRLIEDNQPQERTEFYTVSTDPDSAILAHRELMTGDTDKRETILGVAKENIQKLFTLENKNIPAREKTTKQHIVEVLLSFIFAITEIIFSLLCFYVSTRIGSDILISNAYKGILFATIFATWAILTGMLWSKASTI